MNGVQIGISLAVVLFNIKETVFF